MPQVDITMPANTFDAGQKAELLHTAISLLFKWEGVPENSPNRVFGWAYVHEMPREAYTTAAASAANASATGTFEKPRYRVAFTVPEGVLNAETKAGLIREVTQAIADIEGNPLEESRNRITCYILDVADGAYGVAGQVFHLPSRNS